MAILKLISLLLPSFIVLAKQAVFVQGALYSFPDCVNGPLKDNGVCDTTLDPAARAKALVSLFTIEELTNNTVDAAPGVPRLGLEPYEWWLLFHFLAWRRREPRRQVRCLRGTIWARHVLPTAHPPRRDVRRQAHQGCCDRDQHRGASV